MTTAVNKAKRICLFPSYFEMSFKSVGAATGKEVYIQRKVRLYVLTLVPWKMCIRVLRWARIRIKIYLLYIYIHTYIYIYIHTHIYTHTHIILSVVTRNTLLIFDSYPICYHLLLYSLGFLSRELSDSSFPQPISTVGSFLFRAVDIRLLLCTNDLCTPRTESICSLSGMLPTSRALLSGSWYDNDFI